MQTRRAWCTAGAAALMALGGPACGAQPVDALPGDWTVAPPDTQGLSSTALNAVLDDGSRLEALRSVVVVRAGMLVAERYYAGASAADLLPINSVTKSVASMLVGQALDQGRIQSLAEPVRRLLPDAVQHVPDSAAAELTLAQILTARSGVVYDYRTEVSALASAADPVAYALSRPADPQTPVPWSYNDAAVSLIAPILERAQQLRLEQVAERDLFSALGIERYAWQRDRLDMAQSWSGLRLRPRDLAKLAWLMTDNGRWQGRQVVPAEWVAQSTRPHGEAGWRVAPIAEPGYGYLWFTGRLHGQAVAWGWGYGAQFALLVPELQLAVCTAATAPRPQALAAQNQAVMALVARVVSLAA